MASATGEVSFENLMKNKVSKMTDLEITRLCADAMGFKDIDVLDHLVTYFNDDMITRKAWMPLTDDAQAMEIVKKFQTSLIFAGGTWLASTKTSIAEHADLCRAICECVANKVIMKDEIAWLLERGQSCNQSPTIWWKGDDAKGPCGDYESDWTEDANEAIKFPTESAAERVALKFFARPSDSALTVTITEHAFTSMPRVFPQPNTKEVTDLRRDLEPVYILFDGPPSHESGRFIEVETADGKSVSVGEWKQDGEYWKLGPLYALPQADPDEKGAEAKPESR